MDKIFSAFLIVISIFTSGIASLLIFNFLEQRDRKIKARIEELETEEEYLARMHRDESKLDRSTYTVILMAMCVCFVSLAILAGAFAFGIEAESMKYIYLLAAWLFLVSAGMCFYHFRSLVRLGDFERTRESFQRQKMRLEDRLR